MESKYEAENSDKPSLTSFWSQFDAPQTLILGLSFLAGTLIAVVAFAAFVNTGSTESALPSPSTSEVVDPSITRQALDPSIGAEVAGVVCEDQLNLVAEGTSAEEFLPLWNLTVQSEGDSCTPAFATSLGAGWVMNDVDGDLFGVANSQYQVDSRDDLGIMGVFISLDVQDGEAGEGDALRLVFDTLWGAENIDWDLPCTETDRPWSGQLSSGRLAISIARCNGI